MTGMCLLISSSSAKSFKKVDCTDCEIITFEVEKKNYFSLVPNKDNRV
jgi:hypothetical protein